MRSSVHTSTSRVHPLHPEGFLRRWDSRGQQRRFQDQLSSRWRCIWKGTLRQTKVRIRVLIPCEYTHRPLRLPTDYSKPIQIDLPISHAGAFVYWVEYDGEDGQRVKGRDGYFNVDPVLKIKNRTSVLDDKHHVLPPGQGALLKDEYVNLPLDGLSILTVVSKWMGPIDKWRDHFAEAKERGYTMLHYTPLQERGESNSPYSIRDQMKYDPSMFCDSLDSETGTERVKEVLRIAREEYGLLSLTDVVLNHTANNSSWLIEHPEAGA